jgi:hypothetical protein
MNTLTPKMLDVIKADIIAALAAVAKKHNLSSIAVKKPVYSPNGCFTFKLEGILNGGLSPEAALYNSVRELYPEMPVLNSTVKHDGNEYVIVGSKTTTGSKISVTCKGARYTFTREQILILAGKK